MSEGLSVIEVMLRERRNELLDAWLNAQLSVTGVRTDLISRDELKVESGRFLGGIPGPADSAMDMFARGYDLVIAAADHALLRDAAVALVRAHADR